MGTGSCMEMLPEVVQRFSLARDLDTVLDIVRHAPGAPCRLRVQAGDAMGASECTRYEPDAVD